MKTGRGVVVVDVVLGNTGGGIRSIVVHSARICVVVGANIVTAVMTCGQSKVSVVRMGHENVKLSAGV